MQYNILGGFYTSNEPYEHEQEREKLAIEEIKFQDPDILTICESRFANPNRYNILIDYKKLFGFEFCYVASYKEKSERAIFSKYPFDIKDYAYGLNPLLRAKFKINNVEFVLDLVHQHPSLKEYEKEKFMDHIISEININ